MPFDNQRPARIHRAGRPGVPTYVLSVNKRLEDDDAARRKERLIAQIMGGVPTLMGAPASFTAIKEIARGRRTVRITFDHDIARADVCVGEHPVNRVCSWTERGFVEDFAGLYAAALGLPLSRVDRWWP
jgi:hypothetical protein